jgi:hypothetical protein
MEPMCEVVIPAKEGKGRSFSAIHLAHVKASRLWSEGQTNTSLTRPVYASFMGSDNELKAFVANLMLGNEAIVQNGPRGGFQFLKSVGYKWIWQREEEGSIATAFLPDLFLLDPGLVDPQEAKFILLPPKKWASEQQIDAEPIVEYVRKLPLYQKLSATTTLDWKNQVVERKPDLTDETLVAMIPTAYLFAAYLDRRIRAPIPSSGKFFVHLLLTCLENQLATWSVGTSRFEIYDNSFGKTPAFDFVEVGMQEAGFVKGVAFQSTHEQIEALLAQEIEIFFALDK